MRRALIFGAALALAASHCPPSAAADLEVAGLRQQVDAFLDRELAAHLGAIPPNGERPDRIFGALTTGEFSWGTFMRALGAWAETRGERQLAGRDLPSLIGRIGMAESKQGSKAFAQLYAALALRHFGKDLSSNPVWQGLTPQGRSAWRALLDPTRFYDPVAKRVIGLPENYLGVAARIAAMAWEMGLSEDRAFADAVLDRAARPFVEGALYADDGAGSGRYDRYSNEYARYVWEAAGILGRDDLRSALRPSLKTQMRLWWDLLAPDGYGYPWGRSLGIVSYLDTLEIVAFLARHPEFRPAPLPELVAAYRLAWDWLRRDYRDPEHLLSGFAPGRGQYAYISRDREWQQTVGFFGKALSAQATLMAALDREELTRFPSVPGLRSLARFEFFRAGERPAGVWLVRQGPLRFALPITTGTKPGVADYLPAPHGLPGWAAPVEQVVPALTTFVELTDGRLMVAADGADTIEPGPGGQSLRAVWRRFALVGGKPADWVDAGLQLEVCWRLQGHALVREETFTAQRDTSIRRLWLHVPSTGVAEGARPGSAIHRFNGPEATLTVFLSRADWPVTTSIQNFGDEPLGRGARGAIPNHLVLEAQNLRLTRGRPRTWIVSLEVKTRMES